MFNQQRRQTFATAKEAAETETKKILQVKKPTTFQEAAQVDSMVIAGVIIVGGCTYVAYGTTQETKKDYLIKVLNKLRSLGINKSNIDDEKLAKARRAVWNNMSDGAREQFRWPVPGDAYLPADWGDMNGNGAKALLQGVSCRILDPISSQSRPKSRHGILQCPHQSIPTQAPNRSAPSSPLARRSPTLPFRTVSKMPLAPTRHRRQPAAPSWDLQPTKSCLIPQLRALPTMDRPLLLCAWSCDHVRSII